MLECWFLSWHTTWLPERTSDGLSILAYVNSSFTPGGEWTKYMAANRSRKWCNNFVVKWRLWTSTRGGEWRSSEWEIDEILIDVKMKCIRTSEMSWERENNEICTVYSPNLFGIIGVFGRYLHVVFVRAAPIMVLLGRAFCCVLPNPSRMSFNLYGDMCSFVNFPLKADLWQVWLYFGVYWSGVRPGGVLELLFTLVYIWTVRFGMNVVKSILYLYSFIVDWNTL